MGALTPPVTWTDGGLATTLQGQGLPPATPLDGWLDQRPGAIAAAHRAFVDAGAQVVLAATFRALPGVDPAWAMHLDTAVALALEGAGGRAAVWASFGPGPVPWRDVPPRDRARAADAWATAATRAARQGAQGVVLETFVDPDESCAAARAIRTQMPGLALVACLVPDPDGSLVGGGDPRPAVERLVDLGVSGAGFNCGWGPAGVERALDRCDGLPVRWWAKPAAGDVPPDAMASALARLAERCAWVGGCCGVRPDVLARAIARTPAGPPRVPYSEDPRRDGHG